MPAFPTPSLPWPVSGLPGRWAMLGPALAWSAPRPALWPCPRLAVVAFVPARLTLPCLAAVTSAPALRTPCCGSLHLPLPVVLALACHVMARSCGPAIRRTAYGLDIRPPVYRPPLHPAPLTTRPQIHVKLDSFSRSKSHFYSDYSAVGSRLPFMVTGDFLLTILGAVSVAVVVTPFVIFHRQRDTFDPRSIARRRAAARRR